MRRRCSEQTCIRARFPTPPPRFFNAPRIRVLPQVGFSSAIRNDQPSDLLKHSGALRPFRVPSTSARQAADASGESCRACDRRNLRQRLTTERRAREVKRRLSSSVSRSGWLWSCVFRTRCSSRRYSMTWCCSRWSQPMSDATCSCSGTARRVYVNRRRPDRVSQLFWRRTGGSSTNLLCWSGTTCADRSATVTMARMLTTAIELGARSLLGDINVELSRLS